jgi:hypothetical protein
MSGTWHDRARRALRGAYTRELETQLERERDEVARQRAENERQAAELAQERETTATLRAENRALLNSLLGTVGVPPIETLTASPVQIAPVRRRSWNQIAKAREIESVRQAAGHDRERKTNENEK